MSFIDEIHRKLCASVQSCQSLNTKQPAELFDTHPISGMLVTDNDLNDFPDLIKISNAWRSDWTKNGVQVVTCNSSALPLPVFSKADLPVLKRKSRLSPLPSKLIRCSRDEFYDSNLHHISKKGITESIHYQLDDLDHAWLLTVNEERECLGENKLQDWMLETVLEVAEKMCSIKHRDTLKQVKTVAPIEFDENTRCDVCLSYDGEDGNELVFCDGCFVCIHQACYGIPQLPEGSWLCRRCEMGAKSTTQCVLCPNTGGAMKLVDDYKSWCHVSCALWVPEVAFGDIDLMEPVCKIGDIPQARKNLVCGLCRMHSGAPIQCSVKKCKVAFHVTCAFQKNLVMLQELQHGDVRLLAHCSKHSSAEYQSQLALVRTPKKQKSKKMDDERLELFHASSASTPVKKQDEIAHSGLVDDEYASFHKFVTNENVINLLQKSSKSRFDKKGSKARSVNQSYSQVEDSKQITADIVDLLLTFWRLKRCANFNRPLVEIPESWSVAVLPAENVVAAVPTSFTTIDRLSEATDILNRFKQVRFGLDRARLVIDMVLQREKRKAALLRKQSKIVDIQLGILADHSAWILPNKTDILSTAHLGTSVYDNYALFKWHGDGHRKIELVRPVSPESSTTLTPTIKMKKNQKKASPKQTSLQNFCASDLSFETNKSSGSYIITGNPIIDGMLPDQLIVSVSIRKRLQEALASNNIHRQSAARNGGLTKAKRGRPRTTSLFSPNCQNRAPTFAVPRYSKLYFEARDEPHRRQSQCHHERRALTLVQQKLDNKI